MTTGPLVENWGTSSRQSLTDAIFLFKLSCFVVTFTDITTYQGMQMEQLESFLLSRNQ